MKKIISFFAILMMVMAIPQSVKAYQFSYTYQGQTLYYNIVNGKAQVTYQNQSISSNYHNLSGTLVIPDTVTYNGISYSVTSIGEWAFSYCSGLTSVTIPNSVTSIGGGAFWYCSGLTSVTIPNSVTFIGSEAFRNCSGLTSVTIPNSVTSIGSGVFYDCSGLTSVTIPNSVTSIGGSAFSGCSGLTSVTIGNSVTSIGQYAFSYCSGLTSVTIGNSVTFIGYYAFCGCSGLTQIIVSCGNTHYDSRDNCNAIIETSTITLIAGCQNTIIPNTVTSIGEEAFSGCSGLTSVTIPNSVTSIGQGAFRGCSGLTSVTIPNSVTSIGGGVFYGCSGLTSVTIPNSVTSIGSSAFSGCSGLTSVTIGNSVTSIDYMAFYGCSGLTSVTIPNSVTSIGSKAFENCSGLTSVTFNADSCTSAGSDGGRVFNGCLNITDFTFGNNVRVIPPRLCYGLSSLTSVTIPNSVTSIGEWAFSYCSGLTSVTIPNSVTSIGDNAFRNCSGLASVTFNADNCTSAGSNGGRVFNGCLNITDFTFGNNVRVIPPRLCCGLSNLTSVTIPNSVTSIGSYAFGSCSGLTSVTIPNSVTSIGSSAFEYCSGLTEVTMLSEIAPTLGAQVFYQNDSSRIIKIPCGSYDSYYNGSGWSSYRSALHEHGVDITLTIGSNDSIKGIASIIQQDGREVACDSSAIISATPSYGYHFDHWSNGNTANPDTLHLVGDSTVTAIFVPNQYVLTVQSADESLGSVAGSGTYDYLDTVSISATAINHHHLVHWSDGNRDNPRQVVVTGDMIFSAYFSIDTHTVNVVTSDIARGMVETTGTEFVYGTPCTVTATAYTGYTFAGWSNGVTANPYTFAVLSDVELTAIFLAPGEETYTVTVVSADPTMGTVSGGGQALSGGTVTFSATPNEGYRFLYWNDGNTENPRTVTVTGNITYTAYFESTTQGVSDVSDNKITVYPNPTSGKVKVAANDVLRIDVYNVSGQQVKTVAQESVIDISSLPTGVYTMRVETARSTFVCRVIKR